MSQSSTRQELSQRVDAMFQSWRDGCQPGAAVAVVDKDEVVHRACYGYADLEHAAPITPASHFYICSITKQFTATSLLMLEADGKLSLDDDVHKHVPELPRYPQRLTIRHLLNNASGLRDELTLLTLSGIRFDQTVSRDEMFDLVCRQRSLDFAPGERYRYSNSNFMLASIVVERASGQTFRAFLEHRVFKPLGMASTRLCDDHLELAPHLARPYTRNSDSSFRKDWTGFELSGDGGILSTLDDMTIWLRNLRTNRLQPRDLVPLLSTPGRFNNGRAGCYALGLRVMAYRGLRLFMHGGGLPGYKLELVRFPDADLGIMVMTNRDEARPTFLARAIADIYLADAFPKVVPPKPKPLPPERLVGKMYDRTEGYGMQLGNEGGMLVADVVDYTFGMEQVTDDSFAMRLGPHDLTLRMVAPVDAKYPKIEASLEGGQKILFEHPEPPTLSAAQLQDYVGLYAGTDLPYAYRVAEVEGGLLINMERSFPKPPRVALSPLFPDMFAVALPFLRKTVGGTIAFQRDGGGKVAALIFNIGRVSKLRLERQAA